MDPRSLSPGWLVALAAAAVLFAVAQAIVFRGRKWLRRRRIIDRVTRAGEGEKRAAAWLTDLGYEILGAQVAADYPVLVDGRPVTIGVRADYVVERDGARYVVEVKTGNVAPKIETAATRRQLLEYAIAFDVHGVLLVDAEAGHVKTIAFPKLPAAPSPKRSALAWAIAAVALVAVVIAIAGEFG